MKDQRGDVALAVFAGIGALLLLIAIGWGIWAFGVASSGVHGRGEQIKQINNATNRTFAQEHFEQEIADIRSFTTQIKTTKAQADSHRQQYSNVQDTGLGTNANEQARLDSIVTGLENQCTQTVQNYNADAAKVSQEQFRSANLPAQIDPTDPTINCQP